MFFLSAGSADAHAFRVVAAMTERTGAASADPFVAAFVALFLFFETLLQRFHQLVEAAEGLDLGHQIGRATSELQSLMRISYAVFCLKKQNKIQTLYTIIHKD